MGITEDLADALAVDTLDAMEELDDDRFYEEVSKVIGTSSPTIQEAFLTSIRIRLAERRGRAFIAEYMARARAGTLKPRE